MPRNAGPGGLGKCYLGAARFSYVESCYLGGGGGGGGGLFCLRPCARPGEVLSRTRPVHPPGCTVRKVLWVGVFHDSARPGFYSDIRLIIHRNTMYSLMCLAYIHASARLKILAMFIGCSVDPRRNASQQCKGILHKIP